MNTSALQAIALSVRSLTIDAIQKANSGHPGMPMGAAELGAYLYGVELKYNPKDPKWLNRDRFVLSAGHGSMFLYSLLHLAGFDLSLDDIKAFRQVGSKCPGHPEYGRTPGVETTTGPLGQGIATAVGMAIAERKMSAHFNKPGQKIFDHFVFVLAGDGCMMEGVASEACSLAGHLGLGNLIVYYDSNHISIDGPTDITFSEDVAKRFEAYGWQVLRGSMYSFEDLSSLTSIAKAEKDRPSLIVLDSVIGKGAPTKQGTSGVHGSPLGEEEARKAKEALGIPLDKPFWVAPEAYSYFEEHRIELEKDYAAWQLRFEAWEKANPSLGQELEIWLSGKEMYNLDLPSFVVGEKVATRNASGKSLAAISAAWPNFIGGSADLTSPNVSQLPQNADGTPLVFSKSNPKGRYIYFGVREHAMAAIANGIALYGGLRPFVATFLVFSDYLRPALRLSALMGLPVIYVLTHDSIYVGEDGPTHQPIEALAALRAIPNLRVLRPADAEETAVAWRIAMERLDGPTVLVLSRQNLPVLEKFESDWPSKIEFGAYVVKDSDRAPEVTLVGSGSEVSLTISAAEIVKSKRQETAIRIVSVPDRRAFYLACPAVREAMLSPGSLVFVAEAGVAQGWERIAPADQILSIERFGESGPGDKVAEHLGFTAQALAQIVLAKLD
ncbi:MAG: Transketolase [Spirochaetes bacterium ADurb.Bin110]|nr:MAG: Transketolase [Spirochaetes bacterium ADurb.Bin110]